MIYRCNVCGNLFRKKLNNSSIYEQLMCPKCLDAAMKTDLTLGVGVLHWKESSEMVLRGLRSIDEQSRFAFAKLNVIVVTDGEGIKLDEEYINKNLKNILPTYIYKEKNSHCGGVRNTIIKELDTDYIMFMDCDDVFCNKKAFSRIYEKINKYRPDVYCSSMLEELYDGRCLKYTNLMGLHMCHGKAYKKDFLIRNHIVFDETIKVSEDIGFNMQIYDICDNIIFDHKLISYKWKYNKGSLTRDADEKLKLDSYFRCFDAALTEFNKWFFSIKDRNKFVNENFISMMYNLLYYRIKLTRFKDKKLKEYYLNHFFDYVTYSRLNFKLTDDIDALLNKHLLRHLKSFRECYREHK